MYRYCSSSHSQDNGWHMERHAQNAAKLATSEWCRSRRAIAMSEVEQEAVQDSAEENNIDSMQAQGITT